MKKMFEKWTDETPAFLLLRLWLGMRALFTGIDKYAGVKTVQTELLDEFGMPDMSGAMIEVRQRVYGLEHYKAVDSSLHEAFLNQPLLPEWMLAPYYAVLGPALIVLGLMLLLGLGTRISLFFMGMIYVSLTYGLILIGQDGGISWLGVHIILVAMALVLARHNRLAVLRKF